MIGTENMSEQQAQQWLNYFISQFSTSVAPAIPYVNAIEGTMEATGEIVLGMVPGVDAARAAYEGDYLMAAVHLATDWPAAVIERGVAKATIEA